MTPSSNNKDFFKSKNNSSLYIKSDKQGNICLISLYVDDLIITGGAYQLVAYIKSNLSQEFEMKDLGDLHYCLGIDFWRESGKTFITQSKYARKILDGFQMSECKSISTPLDQNDKLYNSDGSKEADGTLYGQLVGSLSYLLQGQTYHILLASLVSSWLSHAKHIGKLQSRSKDI